MVISFMSEYLEEEGQRLLEEDQRLKEDPEFKVPDSFVQAGKKAIKRTHRAGKPSHRWTRRLAIIAAIVAVLTVSAGALGLHYFWDRLEWDEEHFSFGYAQYSEEFQEADAPLFENWDEDKVYGSLQEALDDFGITEFTEPTWLPEGYEFDGVDIHCNAKEDFLWVIGWYNDGEKKLSLTIIYAPPGERHNTIYEIGGTYEEYNCGEYICLLFNNSNTNTTMWLTPNYECSVDGFITYDELTQIVDSIYNEE